MITIFKLQAATSLKTTTLNLTTNYTRKHSLEVTFALTRLLKSIFSISDRHDKSTLFPPRKRNSLIDDDVKQSGWNGLMTSLLYMETAAGVISSADVVLDKRAFLTISVRTAGLNGISAYCVWNLLTMK